MSTNVDGTALDQLEAEDEELSRIFEELDAHRGSSVEIAPSTAISSSS